MPVMFRPKLVWITRSAPYGHRSAVEFRSAGFRAIAVPVLQVSRLEVDPPEGDPDAIVVLSAFGIRRRERDENWRTVPVFVLGDYTGEAASFSGFSNVRNAAGPDDLVRLLEESVPRNGRIILSGAGQIADALEADLAGRSYRVERLQPYRLRPSTDFELRDALEMLPEMDGICVHSPRGARRVAEVIGGGLPRLTIFCLTPACAEPFAGGQVRIEVAHRATDAELLTLARRKWASRPG